MTFKKGAIVWIKHKDIGFIQGEISKKVMPHHKDNTKWYVSVPHYDLSTPYLESDLKDWINQKISLDREQKINDLGI